MTNIDFAAWAEYLGDAPLAMAMLDRIVDGAIILKIAGKSYRAHRASRPGRISPPASKLDVPRRKTVLRSRAGGCPATDVPARRLAVHFFRCTPR